MNSRDGMTADFARLPAAVVDDLATSLAALPAVDAVLYDVTNKPPATIELGVSSSPMQSHAEFVHLHVHSEYSLLDGAAQLEKLVEEGQGPALPGHRADRPRQPLRRHRLLPRRAEGRHQADPRLRALRGPGRTEGAGLAGRRLRGRQPPHGARARTRPGYRNLIKLVSKAYLEGFYYKPRVDKELLAQHADGLLVLSGCLNSEVSRLISRRRRDAGPSEAAGWYQEVFGKDHYFMEVQAHGLDEQVQVTGGDARHRPSHRRARRRDQRLALSRGGSRARPRGAALHPDRLDASNDPNRWQFSTEEFYVKSAEEMARGLRRDPGGLPQHAGGGRAVQPRRSSSAASTCRATWCPTATRWRATSRSCAREGLAPPLRRDARATRSRRGSAHELAVIEKMGFAGYFLVVWDFIRYARAAGHRGGPRPRLVGGLAGGLLPRHHQHRSHPIRAARSSDS